ncbi:MAG TPA: hypothetical protein VLV15_16135 [Dongiaceae bacterium]|nr:hypothetical protein [Dongiaceae bacterium]
MSIRTTLAALAIACAIPAAAVAQSASGGAPVTTPPTASGTSAPKPATSTAAAKPAAGAPATKPAAGGPGTGSKSQKPPIPASEIEKLLPAGTISADVMSVVTEPRYDALVQKMRASISQNQEWWMEYRKKADAHGIVPWDPKMGITKPEYDEMLSLAMKLHLTRVGTTTLTFKRAASGEVTLDGGTGAPELTGLQFSSDRRTVGGTYGTMENRQDVHQTDAAAPSGIWNGVQWNGMTRDEKSGSARLAMLALGRMSPSNHGLMFLSVREMAGGKPSDKSRIVTYPLGARPETAGPSPR